MIHGLRVHHFRTFAALAVLLPAALAAALAARTPAPRVAVLPEDLARAAGWDGVAADTAPLWRRADLFSAPPLDAALAHDAADRLVLVLQPREEPEAPDLLVYWAPGEEGGGALPDDAVWLGALAGRGARSFVLPPAARGAPGRILLYSLAHAALVDEAALPGAP